MAFSALPEDRGSIPSLTAWLTVALIASSGLYRHQADTEYTGIDTNNHTNKE